MSHIPYQREYGFPDPYCPPANAQPGPAMVGVFNTISPYAPSRREHFALEALKALCANGHAGTIGELAEDSVRLADKLLQKLDKI